MVLRLLLIFYSFSAGIDPALKGINDLLLHMMLHQCMFDSRCFLRQQEPTVSWRSTSAYHHRVRTAVYVVII